MDTSKHTVMLPISDYNKLISSNNNLVEKLDLAEAKLDLIKEIIDHPKMDRFKRLEEIKTILGD